MGIPGTNSYHSELSKFGPHFYISVDIDDETMSPITIFTLRVNTLISYKYKLSSIDIIEYENDGGVNTVSKMFQDMTSRVRELQLNKIIK
jgi:hypothetical protein